MAQKSAILERRRAAGWTQEDLAKAAGICPETLRRAERGQKVGAAILAAIAGALVSRTPPKRQRKQRVKSAHPQGFAVLSAEERKRCASLGGKAAHASGNGNRFTKKEARIAGRKGGRAHSQEHMRAIGRNGGLARIRNHQRRSLSGSDQNQTKELS